MFWPRLLRIDQPQLECRSEKIDNFSPKPSPSVVFQPDRQSPRETHQSVEDWYSRLHRAFLGKRTKHEGMSYFTKDQKGIESPEGVGWCIAQVMGCSICKWERLVINWEHSESAVTNSNKNLDSCWLYGTKSHHWEIKWWAAASVCGRSSYQFLVIWFWKHIDQ